MTNASIPNPLTLKRNCMREMAEWMHWKSYHSGNGIGFQEFWGSLTQEQKYNFLPQTEDGDRDE